MKNIRIIKNPFLFFLPFLLIYSIIILILHSNVLWGDEVTYMSYVNNLLQGFYSPPAPNVSLDYGPGYPLIMLPFVALHLPLTTIKLLNAVFLYLSVILLFKVLVKFVSSRKAIIISLFWACYFNSFDNIALMSSETFSVFLVSLLFFFLTKALDADIRIKTNKYIYLSGFIFGCLILTKIIFGYVLLCMLIGCGFLWIMNRKAINCKKGIFILLIAFTTVLPYLIYTYHLTGRIFYWGTSGGNNLYWMSTPNENEYGNYILILRLQTGSITLNNNNHNPETGSLLNIKNRKYEFTPGYEDSIISQHRKDLEKINKYIGVEKDDAYKRIAIKNIKSHPIKFIKNCISNIGRILFNYPYSYQVQKPETLIRLPFNGIIIVLMLFCIIPTCINWRKIIFPIRCMLFFALLYLGGSIFGSAETRMFTVIVPILLVWIAYITQKSMKFKLKFDEKNKE